MRMFRGVRSRGTHYFGEHIQRAIDVVGGGIEVRCEPDHVTARRGDDAALAHRMLHSVRIADDKRSRRGLSTHVVRTMQHHSTRAAAIDQALTELDEPGAYVRGAERVDDLHAGARDVR